MQPLHNPWILVQTKYCEFVQDNPWIVQFATLRITYVLFQFCFLFWLDANALGINAVVIHQDSTTSESHIEQSESSRSDELTDVSSTVNQIHQDVGKMEQKFYAVEGQMKSYIQKSEESLQRMEVNVDNAFRKAIDVQTINKELQVNNVGIQNQLSLTQQQLLDIQKNNERLQASNEHLQSQMLAILDKLSHTQQQFLDMQKSNEQLQKANAHLQDQVSLAKQQLIDVQKNNDLSQANLQNQLSLTQQQLLGVQSMMTCSRLWVVSHDQFTIGREIGRGAWASVHETTFRGAKVAGKRLHDEITSPETIELFHQEMEMALHCQHQNIVTFLGVTLENHPVILMELMDISLRSAYKRGNVKYWQVLKIFYDIASALHFLHTRPDAVIHRDVSSANVLLKACGNEKWLAKLGDLGTAKLQQYCTTPGPGALAYAAPEVADPKRHSTKMDVYSFGVLVVEILTKTLPFQNLNTLKVRVQQQFPQYYQLVISCTNQQSSGRPTMYDVIEQLN